MKLTRSELKEMIHQVMEDLRSDMANKSASKGLTAVSKETGKRVYFKI